MVLQVLSFILLFIIAAAATVVLISILEWYFRARKFKREADSFKSSLANALIDEKTLEELKDHILNILPDDNKEVDPNQFLDIDDINNIIMNK